MITRKYLEKIVMEEVKFVEEKFMSSKFRKAIEKYQDLQLKQQQLQKAFIGTKDIKQRDKLKKALIKMHYVVKKAEAEFNSALHIEPVEFDESVEKPRAQVNESTGVVVTVIAGHDCEVEHPGIAHKAWDDQQLAESTKSYGDSLEKIARDKQLKMLTKKDKETLLKIADLMKKMKEGTINITKEQSGILKEKAQGLWANIRAKQDRGEAPAKKGSKAYDDAVAAGKKINSEGKLTEETYKKHKDITLQGKKLQKVKVMGLSGTMPGVDFVYYDKKSKSWFFVNHAGDAAELKNKNTLKVLMQLLKKTNIKIEGKLTEAKDRVLNKLFQRSRAVTAKSGEDKLYKLSQDWEDWNVDNDDKYDDLVDHLFAAVELVQDAGTPGVNNVTKDKEWYSYMKSADKHLKTFTKDVMKAMKLHKEGVVTEVDSHTHSNCSCTKQENTTPVNEDEGKVKCSKCNGEGCSHCNNTGFHVAEDKLFPRKPSEKKINKDKK